MRCAGHRERSATRSRSSSLALTDSWAISSGLCGRSPALWRPLRRFDRHVALFFSLRDDVSRLGLGLRDDVLVDFFLRNGERGFTQLSASARPSAIWRRRPSGVSQRRQDERTTNRKMKSRCLAAGCHAETMRRLRSIVLFGGNYLTLRTAFSSGCWSRTTCDTDTDNERRVDQAEQETLPAVAGSVPVGGQPIPGTSAHHAHYRTGNLARLRPMMIPKTAMALP